ncbi:MAG: glutamine--fructose-6-phosphate aminotransferase, partial [Gammaproteobacteria bacterium]
MCGIVGAVAQRQVSAILLEGLKRLEYRGYDSAGMAVLSPEGQIHRRRAVGKVAALEAELKAAPLDGTLGIAHTRWATHGKPTENNAHPHMSGESLAIVHNGIIENFEALREQLQTKGYRFTSDTDTEVIVHLIDEALKTHESLFDAVRATLSQLEGAYALAVTQADHPDRIIVARQGSPLVIGVGIDENFCGSDPLALLHVTDRFIYLEEGDVAEITRASIRIVDGQGQPVEREVKRFEHGVDAADKGEFR